MCRRRIKFEDCSTTEEEIDEKELDDNEMDNICYLFSADTEMCLVCAEFGNNELW